MAETDRADGNVGVGLRGLVSSIVSNVRVHNTIVVACAVGAWGGWSFTPGLWQSYMEALKTEPGKVPILATIVTVLALLATVIPVWLQFHKNWLDSRVAEEHAGEQAELITLIHSFLAPCITSLPQVAKKGPEGREALAGVQQSIMSTVQQICGPAGSGVRVVWFGVEKQTLVPKDWRGGACNSTRKFTNRRNDEAGQAAWATAKTGLPALYPDLSKDAPSGYQRGRNSNYETFITCGVLGVNDEVVGMLNVDAPKANDLTEIDNMVVGVCARLLSAAYCLSDKPVTL